MRLGLAAFVVVALVGCPSSRQGRGGLDSGSPDDAGSGASDSTDGGANGGPWTITYVSGNNQTGAVATALTLPLNVLVTDAHGSPVGGVTVRWTATAGGGVITSASLTEPNGNAIATATLGTMAGPASFTASVAGAGGSPVTFAATAIAGPAATISYNSGNNQTGAAGKQLSSPLSVLVRDAHGNPVSGLTVNWAATEGDGSIAPTSGAGIDGVATATPILGAEVGAETYTASIEGLSGSPVRFTASVIPGSPAAIAYVAGNNQTGAAGEPLFVPFQVSVSDAYGNRVSGATVQWIAVTGGGSVAAASRTGADGTAAATGTLGAETGTDTFTASIVGSGASVTFVAMAEARMPIASASSISAAPATLWADGVSAAIIKVTVKDASGFPVPRQPVVLGMTGPTSALYPLWGTTDLSGGFVAHLTSSQDGPVTVSALVDGRVALSTTVTFTNPVCLLSGFKPASGSPISAGGDPVALTTSDFNGDGKLDIAFVNNGGTNRGTVSILLGDGSGGFTNARGNPVSVGTDPGSLATDDFNEDGILDLAVANGGDGTVSVLLGDGSGGFASANGSPVAVGTGPRALTTGDFNGDGKPDLAVANGVDGTVSVLLGDGSGGFTLARESPIGVGTEPEALTVGDFNGDAKLDLAVGWDNDVSVLLGDGSGGFANASGSPVAVGCLTYSMVAGDFTGDRKLDLAFQNLFGNTVSVLLGNGSGGFANVPGIPVAVGKSPVSVSTGDFNGDGKLDLAVVNGGDGTVSVLLGDGIGGFAGASGSPVAVGSGAGSLAIGDFNSDGKLDLAVANASNNTVTILLNQCP